MSSAIRMTPSDSAFWRMESSTRLMHSATLATFEHPAPTFTKLVEHLARRVPAVPHFQHRVVEVPFDLARPVWTEDPSFSLENHVLRGPSISSQAELNALISTIVSEPLDRAMPLWQLTLLPELPGGQWGLVSKVHHSMIDGLFGTEPLAAFVDDAQIGPINRRPEAAVLPEDNELMARAAAELLVNPVEQFRFAKARVRRRRRSINRVSNLLDPSRTPNSGHPANVNNRTGLRGTAGQTRSWSSLSVEMDLLRKHRKRLEVSTHELVVSLITSGLRQLLIDRDPTGETWPAVKAIVPVAVTGSATGFRGAIAAEFIQLPVEGEDLASRADSVHRQTLRSTSNPVAIDAQLDPSGFPAPALASLGLREATRRGLADRGDASAVIINVPGPRRQLSVLGSPMTSVYPISPLAAGVRLGVGVYSYLDTLTFGVTADADALPDAQVVIDGIRDALES